MAACRAGSRCSSQVDGASEQPSGAGSSSLLASATTWPLKRYGRFLSPTDKEDGERSDRSWQVFESNEESGHLILTIVVSGHFFISQGRTVLDNPNPQASCQSVKTRLWNLFSKAVTIVNQHRQQCCGPEADNSIAITLAVCLLRLFGLFPFPLPIQYSEDVADAYSRLQTLKSFVPAQFYLAFLSQFPINLLLPSVFARTNAAQLCSTLNAKQEGFSLIDSQKWLRIARRADCLLLHAQSKQNECRMFRVQFGGDSEEQTLEHCCSCVQKLTEYVPVHEADELSQNLCYSHSQVEDTEQNTSALHVADEPLPDSFTNFGERRSTMQLAQSVLSHELELPLVYRHSAWSARDLGPFIRLCLMDQHFPAFVEDVEKELKKLTEG